MSDIVEQARALRRRLISTDADMKMPAGMIDPDVLADEIERLRAALEQADETIKWLCQNELNAALAQEKPND